MSSAAGNLIWIARHQSGLSQSALARLAGTSQPAVAAYEAGRRSPSVDTLTRILRAAGFDLRLRLEPYDGHDEWLQRYEESLPREVVDEIRRRDRDLAAGVRRG